MTNRVVMIAYFFPPDGTAGSYRPLRFARHLPAHGWLPTVVTTQPYQYDRYDPRLSDLVPREVQVIRVAATDPWQAFQAWRERRIRRHASQTPSPSCEPPRAVPGGRVRSRLRQATRVMEAAYYQPDLAKHWIQPAVNATLKLCRSSSAVVWATAGPVSSWVVARKVFERTGAPYVLDLRDPWGLSYHESQSAGPKWARSRVQDTMRACFKGAQSIVLMFDSVARAYLEAFPDAIDPRRIHVIPNGYEGEFEPSAPPDDHKCTILYTGTLTGYEYDTLLQGLAQLKTADPTRSTMLRFQFVGEGMDELAQAAAALGLSDSVITTGPAPHSEIAQLQRNAHALLVLGRASAIKGHELFAGAKVFGYLKARRPIIGILPRDETRNVLFRVGGSLIADVNSPAAIRCLLQEVAEHWSNGTLQSRLPDVASCQYYSAERQTQSLVRALEGAPAFECALPATV